LKYTDYRITKSHIGEDGSRVIDAEVKGRVSESQIEYRREGYLRVLTRGKYGTFGSLLTPSGLRTIRITRDGRTTEATKSDLPSDLFSRIQKGFDGADLDLTLYTLAPLLANRFDPLRDRQHIRRADVNAGTAGQTILTVTYTGAAGHVSRFVDGRRRVIVREEWVTDSIGDGDPPLHVIMEFPDSELNAAITDSAFAASNLRRAVERLARSDALRTGQTGR
jgi:hypothetical protein